MRQLEKIAVKRGLSTALEARIIDVNGGPLEKEAATAVVEALKGTFRAALREGKKTVAVVRGKNVGSAQKNLSKSQKKYMAHETKRVAASKKTSLKEKVFGKGKARKADEAASAQQSKDLIGKIKSKGDKIDAEKARTKKYRRVAGGGVGLAGLGGIGLAAKGGKSSQEDNALAKAASGRLAAWREGAEQFAKRVVGRNQKGAKEALETAKSKRPVHRPRKNQTRNEKAADRLARYDKRSVTPREADLAAEVAKTRKARGQAAVGVAGLTAAGVGAKKLSD